MRKKTQSIKDLTPNLQKLPLKGYFQKLSDKAVGTEISQRRRFVKIVAEKTCRNESTIYRWISGDTVTPAPVKKVLSDLLSCEVNELFPTTV